MRDNTMRIIKELWTDFGDVPIDDKENTTEDWLRFKKGTPRFEIWSWFEEEFNVSVAMDLMGLEEDEI